MPAEILKPSRLTAVVDVGASPIDGDPPYKAMFTNRLCTVTGFEPDQYAFLKLNALKTDLEAYHQSVVADGRRANLYHCKELGMSSTLQPNPEVMSAFRELGDWGDVVSADTVDSVRLDDVVDTMDMLKIDIQGGEYNVFDASPRLMKMAVCIHTEVAFVPLYKNHPSFGEVDMQLRSYGYLPHALFSFKRGMIAPLHSPTQPRATKHQLIDGDMIYVRDFTRMDDMTDDQLRHLAIISHYCYGSTDLVVRCLVWLAKRNVIPEDSANRYLKDSP